MSFGTSESSYMRPLTVMFVDIVGFSKVAETHDPLQCFAHVKEILSRISKTIEEHEGHVVKLLGDGLVCVFGLDGSDTHAAAALRCAVEIQRTTLDRDLKAHLGSSPVYPLRIGINTDHIAVGAIGPDTEEITVIGHGVNFAARLEAACDGYSILLGPTTVEELDEDTSIEFGPRKRLVRIKHHDDLIEAYECNPFEDRPDLLNQAIEAYRNFAGIQRIDKRWPVPYGARAKVITSAGIGELINFSEGGLAVILPNFLSRDIQLNVTLEFDDPLLNARLAELKLDSFVAEVRWGRPTGRQYIHGLQFMFQKEGRGTELVENLRQLLLQPASSLPLSS